ncbi:MAG: hypothetical protein ACPGUV_12500 [Polyangiales bacterium]
MACGAGPNTAPATARVHGAPAARPTSFAGRAPTEAEGALLDRLARQASQLRQLPRRRRVRVRIQSRAQIEAHLLSELQQDELSQAEGLYQALGLLARDVNVKGLLRTVLGEQVVGYYSPPDKTLVVRDDVLPASTTARLAETSEPMLVLVHELVHALQDQNLGLPTEHDEPQDSDPASALRALIEGDATLAMLGHAAAQSGIDLKVLTRNVQWSRALLQAPALPGGSALERAPAILRVTLVSAYQDGLRFAMALYRRGGWPAVDAAHALPPQSSEQVLHFDKYERGELPDRITLPALPALTRAGWRRIDEDSLGELELGVYLGQGTPGGYAPKAAEGWSGDRVRAYRHADGRLAAVWFTAWDDAAHAQRAARAAQLVQDQHAGPGAVQQRGRALLIVRGLGAAELRPVRTHFADFAASLPQAPPAGRPFPLPPKAPH